MFTYRTRDWFKKIKTSLHLFLVQGAKQVLVKLGSQGSALFVEGEEPIRQPIIPATEVIDTTGAGDTFTSAFAVVKERFSWLFFSFHIFMYLCPVFYSVCSKYSLDFTYLEAKFICRFQGSRPIMTMPKSGWVLQRKWVWSPPASHRYADFYSNHVRLHDYCSWWRLDTPMGSNIICITFNFICQTYARDLPAHAMARVMN